VILDLGEDLIFCLCLGMKSRALVLNAMAENLDALKCGGWRVFIAPTTKMVVAEAVCRWAHQTVRCATGHCPVRQPRHPTVRVLTVLTVGALTDWGHRTIRCRTGQSLFTVRCAFWCCSDSAQAVHALFTFTVHFCRQLLA
jgi:hypothetical protein